MLQLEELSQPQRTLIRALLEQRRETTECTSRADTSPVIDATGRPVPRTDDSPSLRGSDET
jgi:hypothetical protein